MAFQKQLASRAGQRKWSGFKFSDAKAERAKEGTALAKAVEINKSLAHLDLFRKWAFATRGRIRGAATVLPPGGAARIVLLGVGWGSVDGGV